MLDFSIGEVESLVLKAYRGAGFSWGMAQEAGQAAAWMAMVGLPALDAFAALLPVIDGKRNAQLVPLMHVPGKWSNPSGMLCPVVSGTAFSDGEQEIAGSSLVLENVLQPLILLPFISQSDAPVMVSVADHQYLCGTRVCSEIAGQNSANPGRANVILSAAEGRLENPLPCSQRAIVDDASVEVLNTYAHRTYVPASEASRLAGAGAGLLDND